MSTSAPRYTRVLIKLSGEALAGPQKLGIDPDVVAVVAEELRAIHAAGVEIGVVVGGGNIFRARTGAKHGGIERTTGDYMGMLASVLNALALQDACEKAGVQTRVQSAIAMHEVAEPYIRRRAIRHLEKGRIVIFAAGTGNPYFTTDTAAALRAAEIGAQAIIKATNVEGVYTADPKADPAATLLHTLTFQEALVMGLRVMDGTAFALAAENKIPVLVINMTTPGNLMKAVMGERVGSKVTG